VQPPRVQPSQPASDDRFRGDIDGTLMTRGGQAHNYGTARAGIIEEHTYLYLCKLQRSLSHSVSQRQNG
jgi:hypothetical protein